MRSRQDSVWTGDRDVVAVLADLNDVWSHMRRAWPALGLWVAVCIGLGAQYVRLIEPQFVATVQMVLQPLRIVEEGPEKVRAYRQFTLDAEQADTELQVIRSERLLRRVFDTLDLAEMPEFRAGHDGFWSGLFGLLHVLAPEVVSSDRRAAAFGRFVGHVRSRRIGLTYVIEISYVSPDGGGASRIANAIASAYLLNRIDAAVAGATVSTPYLVARAAQLKSESRLVSQAMADGTVPATYLPDAGVHVLGGAKQPRGQSYPKRGPVLMLAAVMGLVSGLMAILVLHRLDGRVRSPRQVSERFGIDCPGVIGPARQCATGSKRWRPWPARRPISVAQRRVALGQALLPLLHRLPRPLDKTLAFVSWNPGVGSRAAGAGLVELLESMGRPPLYLDLEASSSRLDGEKDPLASLVDCPADTLAVLVLPPLQSAPDASAIVGHLDSTVLVVEAHRTTFGNISAAISTIKGARGRLRGIIIYDGDQAPSPPRHVQPSSCGRRPTP